ncbi:hypothetical protein KIPB_000783, partial [Kipferlia bialata]
VLQCIDDQFMRLDTPKVDVILLVGGFNASPYLVSRITERFRDYTKHIISPPSPGGAVVIGAVHYGWNPSVICSRVSRYSYGVQMGSAYDPSNPLHQKHRNRREWDPRSNAYRLNHLFDTFLTLGEEVPVGHRITTRYYPVYTSQSQVAFQMYQSDKKALFVDDSGVQPLGEPTLIDLPSGSRGADVSLVFGGTEIRLEVTPLGCDKATHSQTVSFKTQSKSALSPDTLAEADGEAETEAEPAQQW